MSSTQQELEKRIESHLVDIGSFMSDDFDTYFVERAKCILDLIQDAMGKPVSDRASDDVIEQFGVSLV